MNATLNLVQHVLTASADIADWYASEHNLSATDFTHQNSSAYGLQGLGEVADQIIEDGISHGILREDENGDIVVA